MRGHLVCGRTRLLISLVLCIAILCGCGGGSSGQHHYGVFLSFTDDLNLLKYYELYTGNQIED